MDPNISAQPTAQPAPQMPQQPVQPVNPSPNPPSKTKRILLIILGMLEIFFPIIGLYLMFSLLDLQHTLGTNLVKPIVGIVFFALTILLAVFQIIAGLFGLETKLGSGKIKVLIITGILFAVFTIPAIMLFVIYPIYNSASNEASSSPTSTPIQTSPSVPTSTSSTTITPSPNTDTSNWKTYLNKDYGFGFKYPSQFTITETEEKPVYQDQNNESINRYTLSFSTGKVLPDGGDSTFEDFSGFSIDIGPNNGMTIDQYYKGLTQNGDSLIIKHLAPYGNAIEAADIMCYSCSNTTERFGKYFYSIIPFQNAAVLPDGSDDVWEYSESIFSTLKFTQ